MTRTARTTLSPAIALLATLAASASEAQQLHQYSLDQQVRSPSATMGVMFVLNQPSGFTIDSMTIYVDGVGYAATISSDRLRGSITWNSSQATNPSEHHAYATAMISRWIYYPPPPRKETQTISSLEDPSRGDGFAAEFIIADIKVRSLQYDSDVGLSNNFDLMYDASQSVPRPQVTWSTSGSQTAAHPARYVRSTRPRITLDVYPLTGGATTGLTMCLQAYSSNYQANLYATGGVEQTGFPMTRTSQNALPDFVSKLTAHLDNLQFNVRFSRTQNWAPVGAEQTSYNHALYVVLATPAAPMSPPWVPVLNYACTWAYGAAEATTATSALTVGLYQSCTYNGGSLAHTTDMDSDQGETFYLLDFLNDTPPLRGQCRDFADLLVCLSNAVGAQPLQSQKSTSVYYYNSGSYFWTQPICVNQAYTPPGSSFRWRFHQWTAGPCIWDGCLVFGGTSTPSDLALSDYVAALRGQPYALWSPQVSFIPTVQNSP